MSPIKHKTNSDFRIESNRPLKSPHWAVPDTHAIAVHDRALAVAMAAKMGTIPCGGEIRVVHTLTGEVIFSKQAQCM